MLPLITEAFSIFVSGRLSPVIADVSKSEIPSTIIPSTGTVSPGRTSKISDTTISSLGISSITPLRITVVFLGTRFKSLVIASEVFFFAFASKNFPNVTNVIIIEAESKYKLCSKCSWIGIPFSKWWKIVNSVVSPYASDAILPTAISEFIFGESDHKSFIPLMSISMLTVITGMRSKNCTNANVNGRLGFKTGSVMFAIGAIEIIKSGTAKHNEISNRCFSFCSSFEPFGETVSVFFFVFLFPCSTAS